MEIQKLSESENVAAAKKRNGLTIAEIRAWLVSYLARELQIPAAEIGVTVPFDRFGLDSVVAVVMTGDLEDWLGRDVDPTLVYDYPTIEALARHLAEEAKPAS